MPCALARLMVLSWYGISFHVHALAGVHHQEVLSMHKHEAKMASILQKMHEFGYVRNRH
jgi:hypothetical protein